jgi:hypothetical protein
MLLRKSVLNKIGNYWMSALLCLGTILTFRSAYAWRVTKTIISQKLIYLISRMQQNSKFSWDYIKHFYGAMIIFAAKYLLHMPEIKIPGIPQIFAPKYEIER